MRRLGVISSVLLASELAQAQQRAAPSYPQVELLSPARKIPRSWSASRDAPAMNLVVLPRDIRTLSSELSLLTLSFERWSLRSGFVGLIELESEGETLRAKDGFPSASGRILWRGSYAYYAAVSGESLARKLCGGCELELGAIYRHESQHYTGSNSGGDGSDERAEPYIGNDLSVDLAVLERWGQFLSLQRVEAKWFLPGQSSYDYAPSLDLHVRYARSRWLQPFVSGYAEYLRGGKAGGRKYPDAYLLRALWGVALPSRLGDIMVYGFGDVGNRKGIVMLTRERTLGLGIRLALGGPTHAASGSSKP